MSNGSKSKGAKIVRRPQVRFTLPALAPEVQLEDHSWRSQALTRWPRGIAPADAPPPCNEWTRGLDRGRMAP